MFRCYFCDCITPPKTTRSSVVVEFREKRYESRRRESPRRGARNRDETPADKGGSGSEIIKEVDACPACAVKHGNP